MGWFRNRVSDQPPAGHPAARVPPSPDAEVLPDGPLWPPLVALDAAGRPCAGAGLDRIFHSGDLLVVTGWTCGASDLGLVAGPAGAPVPPAVRVEVPRPDVATVYPFPAPVTGFLALWHGPLPPAASIRAQVHGEVRGEGTAGAAHRQRALDLAAFPAGRLEGDLTRIAREYAPARAPLFDLLRDRPQHLKAITSALAPAAHPGGPRGHLDILKVVPGAGGICAGWTLGRANFFLVDDAGGCVPLTDSALRWNRPDIFQGFETDYGAECADAGFLQVLAESTPQKAMVRLVARAGEELVLVHERAMELAPLDAVGFARWAFALPVPPERMAERLRSQDGALLRRLIARSRGGAAARPPVVRRAGPQTAAPEVSLIIPLFGRADFVDHQLLEFADDPFIATRCEVIYVVDDPNLSAPVFAALERWWQFYGVPLTAVWGGRNRGFSGANNLGLSLARGDKVLFLNSDVVPAGPGWLHALAQRLDAHPRHALLGARLLFPGGGLQHDGMAFEFDGTYGVWLNQHPGKGLPPPPAAEGAVVDWPAATGACLIGRRAQILALGGFSEDYLIGDFEDSDLCLKAEAAGHKVGVCPDIALTHLERQSFALSGTGEFRLRVMLFNAWLHQERWREPLARHALARAAAEGTG